MKIFAVILGVFAFYQNAFAYVDPGTGSYLLQIFIGVFTAALVTGKMFFIQIKMFFSKSFGAKAHSNEKPPKSSKEPK